MNAIQKETIEQYLKIEVVSLDKRIAKQLPVIHWPKRDQYDSMKMIGFICRDAIERDSMGFALVVLNSNFYLVPFDHLNRDDQQKDLPRIYIK